MNNYFVGGPSTPKTKSTPFSRGNGNFNLYQSGNYFDNNQNGTLDGQLIEATEAWYPGIGTDNFKTADFYTSYPSLRPKLSAKDAYTYLISNVGAILPQRDQVDAFLIKELQSKGTLGFYTYRESDLPLENGGLGIFEGADIPLDSDNDGIPDVWEEKLKLDKNNSADALRLSNHQLFKGYLNLEAYLILLAQK